MAKNEFNAKGRRMVFEEDIKKIGEGGGGEYTAGTGIDITEDVISVDTTTIQEKLTAGSGISIDSDTNTISATVSGANFVDFVDMTNKSTVTTDEYNAILNGEKRVKYDAQVYEVAWIITEPDWSGFTGIRLESSAPGMIKLDTNSVGKVNAVIWAPGTAHEYEFERNEDAYVKANTGDTPDYTLTDIKVGDNVYSIATGTTVVANSTATPSATLTTLQVGTDTYEVPQGGGSSYNAGTGINISSNTISIDNTVVPRLNSYNTFTYEQAIKLDTTNHSASSPAYNPSIEIVANKGYSSSAEAKLLLNYYTSGTKYNAGEIKVTTGNELRISNKNTSSGNASMYFGQNTSDGLSGRGLYITNTFIRFNNNGKTITLPEKTGTFAITDDITNTIPECPTTTDGTYVLEATVSSGVVTYAWVLKQ